MSHFTVVVCLDDPADVWDDLRAALAPFDETREVAPYRKYLPGEPAGDPVYELSTYNPDSKWDSWGVGGDPEWGHFRHHEGHEWQVLLGHDEPWDRARARLPSRHCHGGPKASLDLDGLRAENVAGVAACYDRWLENTAGTAEARPWREFYRQATESSGYSMAKAEKDYFAQPRLRALKGTEFEFRRLGCPIEAFQKPLHLLLEQARLVAVPGWATLTTDGRWLEQTKPGRIGFPPKDEHDHRYLEDANAYIDSLPDTAWLIAADCHI
jgi:hypothetical protein